MRSGPGPSLHRFSIVGWDGIRKAFLFPYAVYMMGHLHALWNAVSESIQKLPGWVMMEERLRTVASFCNDGSIIGRFVELCIPKGAVRERAVIFGCKGGATCFVARSLSYGSCVSKSRPDLHRKCAFSASAQVFRKRASDCTTARLASSRAEVMKSKAKVHIDWRWEGLEEALRSTMPRWRVILRCQGGSPTWCAQIGPDTCQHGLSPEVCMLSLPMVYVQRHHACLRRPTLWLVRLA